MINSSKRQTPTADYDDHEIFGLRAETNQLIDRLRAGNDSECVLVDVGTFASKEKWKLRDLVGVDRRLLDMLKGLKIEHALPIQRYSWPKIHRSAFATLIISPQATGKTFAHILYAVSRCILSTSLQATNELLDDTDRHHFQPCESTRLEQLIIHPKFIIVCSSQDHVDMIHRTIEQMKEKAHGLDAADSRRSRMPPVSRTINVHQDVTKLATRCNESDILIGTPPTVLKCLRQGFIHFAKCKKVFFDDLDVMLQLQNNNIRELIKIYIRQSEECCHAVKGAASGASENTCRIQLFSRKWTDLVRQFMSSVFVQRTLLFGSLAEASVYNNVKFGIELYQDLREKCAIISALIGAANRDKIGIVTRTDKEATSLGQLLTEMGHSIKMLRKHSTDDHARNVSSTRPARDTVFVLSDSVLEFEVEISNRRKPLDDIMHIIHAALPDDMLLFDQRFRLSFRHIQDKKSGLTSTVLVGPDFNVTCAKQLYDLMARSSTTQTASKLLMRDLISDLSTHICWRWASTGLCRLEKLSREDRFGSFCPDRHSFNRGANSGDTRWPESGQVKLTITHIISPSEFYFWFESRRKLEDGKWTKLEKTGIDHVRRMQQSLDKFKLADICSVPLDRVRRGRVFGVYFAQEARVDRVRLLDEPKQDGVNAELEYSKLIPVTKIDYGSRLEVYVKNLIELPEGLAKYPVQCHRAFHLGYKPTDNEPNWLYKSKKRFYDAVTANGACDVTAWLRMNRDNCFWFENLTVSRRLSNIDSAQVCSSQPHRDLHRDGLADLATSEPPGMSPSTRLVTMCKWDLVRLKDFAQYAFLRQDISMPEIILLSVLPNLHIVARQSCFNKQLEELERAILADFSAGKLTRLNYFAEDVYCIARVLIVGSQSLNRVKIIKVVEQEADIESHDGAQEAQVQIYCLDHGDRYTVPKSDLYQALPNHISQLPFQAFECELANIAQELLTDRLLNLKMREQITDLTRFQNNDYRPIKCQRDENGHLYLFVQGDVASVFQPLSSLLLECGGLKLHATPRSDYETPLEIVSDENGRSRSDGMTASMNQYILDLLRDIVKEELDSARVAAS